MDQVIESNPLAHTLAGIIDNQATQSDWRDYHHFYQDKNPGPKVAEEIKNLPASLEEWEDKFKARPHLLRFTREVVDIERGALRSRLADPIAPLSAEENQQRIALDNIAGYLSSILPEDELPPIKYLPKDQQKFLKMLESETAQPFAQPISRSAQSVKNGLGHLGEEAIAHRKALMLSAPMAAYMVWLMSTDKISINQNKLTPDNLSMTNFSADMLDADDSTTIERDYTLFDPNYKGGCHSHIAAIVPHEAIADAAVAVGIDKVLGPHCSKLDKGAATLQEYTQLYGEFAIERTIGEVSENPPLIFKVVKPGSPAETAFLGSAQTATEHVAMTNVGENAALHTAIPAISYGEGLALILTAFAATKFFKNSRLKKAWNHSKESISNGFSTVAKKLEKPFQPWREAAAKAVEPLGNSISRNIEITKDTAWNMATHYAPGRVYKHFKTKEFKEQKAALEHESHAHDHDHEHHDHEHEHDHGHKHHHNNDHHHCETCEHGHDSSFWKTVGNFGNRTLVMRGNPLKAKNTLGWTGFIGGAGYAISQKFNELQSTMQDPSVLNALWLQGQGLNAEAVWLGVGGMIAGNTVHKLHKYFTRRAHVSATTENVKNDLVQFATPENTVLNSASYDIPQLERKKTDIPMAAVSTAGLTTFYAADTYLTGGQNFGAMAGYTLPWGTFLAINPIEDTTVHGGLGLVGYGAGIGTGATLVTTFTAAELAVRTPEALYKTGDSTWNGKKWKWDEGEIGWRNAKIIYSGGEIEWTGLKSMFEDSDETPGFKYAKNVVPIETAHKNKEQPQIPAQTEEQNKTDLRL